MATRNEGNAFLTFLSRICTTGPADAADRQTISNFPPSTRTRSPELIPRRTLILIPPQFMEAEFLNCRDQVMLASLDEGLASHNLAVIPSGGHALGSGAFGSIILAYRLDEGYVRLEARHMLAVKVQPSRHFVTLTPTAIRNIWNEIDILRGCAHDNIIDYSAHFCYRVDCRLHVAIITEYANAGDLAKECSRYPREILKEECALYYTLQIGAGLDYLHGKLVQHNDLHERNVLLKYNKDGSKTCMLCDFGLSNILNPHGLTGFEVVMFKKDIRGLVDLVFLMTCAKNVIKNSILRLSPECQELLKISSGATNPSKYPGNFRQLKRQYAWFDGKPVAPFPKPPTPVLRPETVQAMGYQMPRDPAAGWTRMDRARRRVLSLPQVIRGRFRSTESRDPGNAPPPTPASASSSTRPASNATYTVRSRTPTPDPFAFGRSPVGSGSGGGPSSRRSGGGGTPSAPQVASSSAGQRSGQSQRSVRSPPPTSASLPEVTGTGSPPPSSTSSGLWLQGEGPARVRSETMTRMEEAARAAADQEERSPRPGFGARIRRSLSSMGQTVAGCFRRRNRSPSGGSGGPPRGRLFSEASSGVDMNRGRGSPSGSGHS